MKEFVNRYTGSRMFVDDSRVDEYVEAGHKPVSTVTVEEKTEEKQPVRRSRKKEVQ